MTSGVKVRMSHIRAAKLCAKGAREWSRMHGFNWQKFVAEGLPVEDFEATGDVYGLTVARIAREEAARGL